MRGSYATFLNLFIGLRFQGVCVTCAWLVGGLLCGRLCDGKGDRGFGAASDSALVRLSLVVWLHDEAVVGRNMFVNSSVVLGEACRSCGKLHVEVERMKLETRAATPHVRSRTTRNTSQLVASLNHQTKFSFETSQVLDEFDDMCSTTC